MGSMFTCLDTTGHDIGYDAGYPRVVTARVLTFLQKPSAFTFQETRIIRSWDLACIEATLVAVCPGGRKTPRVLADGCAQYRFSRMDCKVFWPASPLDKTSFTRTVAFLWSRSLLSQLTELGTGFQVWLKQLASLHSVHQLP